MTSSAAAYWQKATDCQQMAEQCNDEWSKEMLLKTAEIWRGLGSPADETIARKSAPRTVATKRTVATMR
jgi:hypothetical protein